MRALEFGDQSLIKEKSEGKERRGGGRGEENKVP